MKGHLYQFTVEHLEDPRGQAIDSAPLEFKVRNHDDIFKIVEALKARMPLDETDATAFAIGIKLFGEVMLKNRDNPLFKEFKPQFTEFMKALKKQ